MRTFAAVVLILIILTSTAYAHTVSINFAYSISPDRSDEIRVNDTDFSGDQIPTVDQTFYPEKRYISSSHNGVVAALVSAGEFIDIYLRTAYSPSAHLFQITEGNQNRFVLAFTKGSWQNIEDNLYVPERTFGSLAVMPHDIIPYFLRLEYNDVDFQDSLRISGPSILDVHNRGESSGKTLISVGVVE